MNPLKLSALTILLLILFNLVKQPLSAQEKKYNTQAIDSFIKRNMEESGLVGIGASIIVDNKVVWMKGYGYADNDKKTPFTPNTIINIASITKAFTGVCILKAVEDGKLSLDEDINKYLPFRVVNPYFPEEKITLRDIGSHTSSLNDREDAYNATYQYGGDSPIKLEDFLKSYFEPTGSRYSKENFLKYKPGQYREYSNIAAALAGYIVERVTGMQLNEYSKKVILDPLKMKNTGWFLSEINLSNHALLYDKQGDTLKLIPLYSNVTYPDGGVRSSISELSRFFIALLNDGVYQGTRILKKTSVDTMQRMRFTASNKPVNVDPAKLNSGIFWVTKDGGTKIGNAGTDPGIKTEMLSDPGKQFGVILFTNTTLSNKNLLKYYFGIYDELWNYAKAIKAGTATPGK
jgi:CubicO group peptidase (beta-lactamase class C family)